MKRNIFNIFFTMHGSANGKHGACIYCDTLLKEYISGPFEDIDAANRIASMLSQNRNSPAEVERNAEAFSDSFRETIIRPFQNEDMGEEMNSFVKQELAE